MKITIGGKNLDLTPSLETYVGQKIGALGKFLKKFEKNGEVELRLELLRTTKHHRKGDVFTALVEVRLPGKVLRAQEDRSDIRVAIDAAKDTLRLEIEKYKEKDLDMKRGKK